MQRLQTCKPFFSRLSIKPNGYTCCNNRSYQEKHNYEIHITDFPATFYRTYIIRKTKNSSFKNEKSKKEVDVTITVSNKDIV